MAKYDEMHLEGEGIVEYDRLRKYLELVYLYGCFDIETMGKIHDRSAKDGYAMTKLAKEIVPLVKTNDMYRTGKGKSLRYERKYDASARNRMTDSYMMRSLDKKFWLLVYLRLLQQLQQGSATVPQLSRAMYDLPQEIEDIEQFTRYHVGKMLQNGYVQVKNGVYTLVDDGITGLTDASLQELHTYVCFTSGVTYPRVPGSFLCRTLERELRRRGLPVYEDSVFLLRSNSHHTVFDEEVVFRLLQLIQNKQSFLIDGTEYLPVKMRVDSRLGRWYVLMAQEYKGQMQPVIRSCSRLMLPEAFGHPDDSKWEAALAAVEAYYPEEESLFSGSRTEQSTPVEVKLCFGEERGRQQQFCRELRLGRVVTREDGEYYQVQIRDPLELVPLLRAYSPWLQILPGEHDLCNRMAGMLQEMQDTFHGAAWPSQSNHHRSLKKRSGEAQSNEKKNYAEEADGMDWTLCNRFQGRLLQYSLDLLSDPVQDGTQTALAKTLAKRYGFEYEKQILDWLAENRIFAESNRSRLPMSTVEREYLQYILNPDNVPEVELFLSEQTRQALKTGSPRWEQYIQWPRARGMTLPRQPGTTGFRKIIRAIQERRLITYRYRTRGQTEDQKATCLPWKLEYSAYDRRWWIILYDLEERRTIKTPLSRLRDVTLSEEPCSVSDDDIMEAMKRLRMKDPVVLHIYDSHNALQRCFTIFENQEITGSDYSPENGYVLKMHAFRFDREEILRQLMYLGPNVRLVEPADLREELRQRLDQAQKNICN